MGNTPNTATSHHDRGRPPLAVWPCAPRTQDQPPRDHEGEVGLPDRLAHRLVVEYTRPGQVVADLTGTDQVAEHAYALDRRHQDLNPRLHHPGAITAQVQEVAWADLAVTTVSAPTSCVVPAHVRRRRVRARLEFAALITRPGGIVAVITPIGHAPWGVVDPAPGVVRAAASAGLVYLQHVVAVTAPICEAGLGEEVPVRGQGGFDPDADLFTHDQDEVGLSTSVAEAAATITAPAHLNVSVFRKKGRSATTVAAREVGA